ncbi:oxidoreductase [Apiospora arundinis]
MAVLLLIGGDVIAKAIAQLSGTYENRGFTPVLFSFGWVSYAFTQISNAIGNGAFYPAPDYPGVIISMTSGDKREIRSWILARLLRDCERQVDRDRRIAQKQGESGTALHIAVYAIDGGKLTDRKVKSKRDWLWWSFMLGLLIQLILAAVPMMPTAGRQQPNFYVLLITVIGTLLSFAMASQRGTRQEKFGLRTGKAETGSKDVFALTKGNGHNIALIILPDLFPGVGNAQRSEISHLPFLDSMAISSHHQTLMSRLATGFWAILWIVLLLMIGGSLADSWFLLGVGGVGMIHTSLIASCPRSPEAHGIPLKYMGDGWTMTGSQKMDALLRLEELIPGAGFMLRREFFNGPESSRDRERWRKFAVEEGLRRTQLEKILSQADLQPNKKVLRVALKLDHCFPSSQNTELYNCWRDRKLESIKRVHLRGLFKAMVMSQEDEKLHELIRGLTGTKKPWRLSDRQVEIMVGNTEGLVPRSKRPDDSHEYRKWLRRQLLGLRNGVVEMPLEKERLKKLVISQAEGLEVEKNSKMRKAIDDTLKPWEERMSLLIEMRRDQWRSIGEFVQVQDVLMNDRQDTTQDAVSPKQSSRATREQDDANDDESSDDTSDASVHPGRQSAAAPGRGQGHGQRQSVSLAQPLGSGDATAPGPRVSSTHEPRDDQSSSDSDTPSQVSQHHSPHIRVANARVGDSPDPGAAAPESPMLPGAAAGRQGEGEHNT